MTWLSLLATLLLVTLCVSSGDNDEHDAVEVLYPERTINTAAGSSVKLSCNAQFYFKECGLLHVAWHHHHTALTDPRRYLTTVNETSIDDVMRLRQVVTEILSLTPEDAGQFQCRAVCDEAKDSAMGHFIKINIIEG